MELSLNDLSDSQKDRRIFFGLVFFFFFSISI